MRTIPADIAERFKVGPLVAKRADLSTLDVDAKDVPELLARLRDRHGYRHLSFVTATDLIEEGVFVLQEDDDPEAILHVAELGVVMFLFINAEVWQVMAELNVERVESFASAGDLVDYSAKGNFRALGKRFGKQTQEVATAVASPASTTVSRCEPRTKGRPSRGIVVAAPGRHHHAHPDRRALCGWAVRLHRRG